MTRHTSQATSHFATALRFSAIAAAIILLAAIATCSLAPSPNMREMWWIPTWLGTWADNYPNFRNFPVFAVFAALLFFVWNLLSPISEIRPQASDKSFGLLVPRLLVLRRAALRAAVCASALGVLLEVAQLLFLSNRHFDWADIEWTTSGAFVGAALAAACFRSTGSVLN